MACELKISLVNDQTMFCPNQYVEGFVTINLTENCRFRGLKITLHGTGICKFKESNGKSILAKEQLYIGRENYVSSSMYIFKYDELKDFKAGKYTYPFRCYIAPHVPASLNGKYGKIRYYMEACLKTADSDYDVFSKLPFTVIRFEDLSKRVDLMRIAEKKAITTFGFLSCRTKPLLLKASISKQGFVSGELIRVTIYIENSCGFDVTRTKVSLRRVHSFISKEPEVKSLRDIKTIAKCQNEGVKHRSSKKILAVLEVPKLTLSSTCDMSIICQMSYFLQVSAHVIGFFKSPKVRIDLVIGAKPLDYFHKLIYVEKIQKY